MTSNLRANPDGLAGVGAALNRIADRLAHIVDEATVRTPLAAGNDEVSRRVAAKLVCAAGRSDESKSVARCGCRGRRCAARHSGSGRVRSWLRC